MEREHGATWRTWQKALDSARPEPRKKLPPRETTLDPFKPVIDEDLRADLDSPRRQRHTVTRTYDLLFKDRTAGVSYGIIRRYGVVRKPQIVVEAGQVPLEVFMPQTHPQDMEAEVDFGGVTARLACELGNGRWSAVA